MKNARLLIGQVDLLRVVGAVCLRPAARRAARRRALGRALRPEVAQAAEGGHPCAPLARQPDEVIQIVAALGQQHERRFLFPAPVAAHEAVRLMPVAHVLQRLDAHDVAHLAALDGLKDLRKERRIAQHMADDHAAARLPRCPFDQLHVGLRCGDRLFQQQVVALFHRRHRMTHMHRVLRADERHVRQPFAGKHLLARLKAHVRRNAVASAHGFALFLNRLGHGGDYHLAGEHLAHRCVGILAAAAQAADRHAHGIAHFHIPSSAASGRFFFEIS